MSRKLSGVWLIILMALGFGLSFFHVYTGAFGTFTPLIQRAAHLAPLMIICFLLYPAGAKSPQDKPSAPDVIFALISAVFGIYFVATAMNTMERMWFVSPLSLADKALGVACIVLLLEATRRSCGTGLMVTVLIVLAYAGFGSSLPGVLGHPGFNVTQMVDYLVWSDQGIFGIPLGVSATYVALFVILGAIMTKIGINDVFRDISLRVSYRTVGGPAKIATVFSAMIGMTTGSSAANVYSAGNFTIPLMKQHGYPPHYAGGIEATASCGGQIMPPVMGAGAFVMAEFLGITYTEIMARAIIPAILYYAALYASVHFMSKRLGMTRPERVPYPPGLMKRLYMLLPLIVLVASLLSGASSMTAAFLGCISAFVIGAIRKFEAKVNQSFVGTKISWKDMFDGMYLGGVWLASMAIACAAAGIIVGVLSMTGLGMAFVGVLTALAGNNFWLIAFFTMIACIILGMGMPTTTAYILAAAFAGPALIKLGVPALVTHFYIFFFAVFANITPPVAVASYAAAQVAQTDIMSTSWVAIRVGISAMIIPYMFLISPALLGLGTPVDIIVQFATALIGVVLLSAGVFGFFHKSLSNPERVLFDITGLLFIYPDIRVSLVGAAIVAVYVLIQYFFTRSRGQGAPA